MNKKLITILLIILTSCNIVQESDVPQIQGNIIFFNGLAETLSVLNIETDNIENSVETTGIWPNHVTFDSDLILVNSGDNSISIIDIKTLYTKKEIYLGSNKNPWMSFPIPNSNYIYVSCYLSNEVIKIDRNNGEIISNIPVQNNPQGGVLIENRLFIGNTKSDTISVIDITTDLVDETIILPITENQTTLNAQTIVPFKDKGEIHIVCTGNNNFEDSDGMILVMDLDTLEIKETINIGGSPVFSEGNINSEKKLVYLYGTTGITAYNYETYEIIETGINDIFISGLIYVQETNKLYASDFDGDSILIYKGDDYSYEKSVQASDGPQQLLYIKE